MIQRFADWLVYGVFGLNAETPLGTAVNIFFYDIFIVYYKSLGVTK